MHRLFLSQIYSYLSIYIFIGVKLFYNVVFVSAIQQNESTICVSVCMCVYIDI